MIPYGRQAINEDDIQSVVDVLRSDFLTQGPVVPKFERAVADYCKKPYAVAVNSATSALHIACLSLDVGPGDWLWTTPITFVATANCGRYCGAHVDFVDVDEGTWNVSVSALSEKLAQAANNGRLPKVVIPVDFAGQACDLSGIRELAYKYGFKIIEDASHAIGGSYRGAPIGSANYADITVFSFHPVKIITTAEGGVAVTSDPYLAARMSRLRSHGVTRDPAEFENESPGQWYYEMVELGLNYRMTELQGALGASQMKRLEEFVGRRRFLAHRYDVLLADSGLLLPQRLPYSESAWHLYVVGWNEERSGKSRAAAFAKLRAAGIGVNVHYIPVHLQPYYRRLGFHRGQFPIAEEYYERSLSIPIYPGLTDADQDQVVKALRETMGK